MQHFFAVFTFLTFMATGGHAQQFTGMSGLYQPGISQVTLNPAWVNSANTGLEIQVGAISGMAGTNAYLFSKEWVTGGLTAGASEGDEYQKNFRSRKNRHLWGNLEILGPAIAFSFRKDQTIGIYTRMRQVNRGGNLSANSFNLIGGIDPLKGFPDTMKFENAGYSAHVFGELGLTYGRILGNDDYNIFRGGITVKYLRGMAAGSIYTPFTTLAMHTADSVNALTGDVTVLYSANALPFADNDFGNDISSWFNQGGGGSIGFDIGFQYEHRLTATPNEETPYLYRISAALTDIGSVPYSADTNSAAYTLRAKDDLYFRLQRNGDESIDSYFNHLEKDSIAVRKDSFTKFRMGLPTAFRLNGDLNIAYHFWVGANIILNMRGDNGDAYRAAYVNMLNLTPRYENKWLMIGLPFTFWGYETLSTGLILRAGPLYLGSASIISNLINKQIRQVDAYAGVSFKINNKKKNSSFY